MRHPAIQVCQVACLLAVSTIGAGGAVYMKISGIPGESTEDRREGWIDLETVSFGVIGPDFDLRIPSSHRPLYIRKPIDKATPLLLDSMRKGTLFPEVVIAGSRTIPPDTAYVYFRIRLHGAAITEYKVRDVAAGFNGELLQMKFPAAEWDYQIADTSGTIIENVSAFWDIESRTGGDVSDAPLIQQPAELNLTSGDGTQLPLEITDTDTPVGSLLVTATSGDTNRVPDPAVSWNGVQWILNVETLPTAPSSWVPVTVEVSDGTTTRSASFTVYIDSTGTPWEGFMSAYFTEEERETPSIASPIEDPDFDELPTVMEFLLGSNPREFTPQPDVLTIQPEDNPGGGKRLRLIFQRRTDEPDIRLRLLSSTNGTNWDVLSPASSNPLYEESATTAKNPLFEDVEAIVTPPDGANSWTYLLRMRGDVQ